MKANQTTKKKFKNLQVAAIALAEISEYNFQQIFGVAYSDYDKLKISIEEIEDTGKDIEVEVTFEVFENYFK